MRDGALFFLPSLLARLVASVLAIFLLYGFVGVAVVGKESEVELLLVEVGACHLHLHAVAERVLLMGLAACETIVFLVVVGSLTL